MPRSRWSSPRSATPATTGPSGSNTCAGSCSFPVFRLSTVAANATSPSFANSDGCRVTGPRSIHRDAPYSDVPDDGRAAITIRIAAPARSGIARVLHRPVGTREIT